MKFTRRLLTRFSHLIVSVLSCFARWPWASNRAARMTSPAFRRWCPANAICTAFATRTFATSCKPAAVTSSWNIARRTRSHDFSSDSVCEDCSPKFSALITGVWQTAEDPFWGQSSACTTVALLSPSERRARGSDGVRLETVPTVARPPIVRGNFAVGGARHSGVSCSPSSSDCCSSSLVLRSRPNTTTWRRLPWGSTAAMARTWRPSGWPTR